MDAVWEGLSRFGPLDDYTDFEYKGEQKRSGSGSRKRPRFHVAQTPGTPASSRRIFSQRFVPGTPMARLHGARSRRVRGRRGSGRYRKPTRVVRRHHGRRVGRIRKKLRMGRRRKIRGGKSTYSGVYRIHEISVGRLQGTAGEDDIFIGNSTSPYGITFGPDEGAADAIGMLLTPGILMDIWTALDVQIVADTTPNALPASTSYQRPLEYSIDSGKVATTYQNVNNFGHYVHCYYCKPRDHIGSAVGQTPGNFLSGAASAESIANVNRLGLTLFDFPEFCSLFKVFKQKKVFVGPGESTLFVLHSGPKKVNMNKYFHQTAQTGAITTQSHYTFLRHFTQFLVLQIHGVIGNDSVTKTPATVTVGGISADLVTTHEYHARSKFMPMKYTRIIPTTSVTSVTGALPVPAVAFDTVLIDQDVTAVSTAA